MKAKFIDNFIVIGLPSIYNGITGSYVGDFSLQPDYIHNQEGFYDVVEPDFDPFIQSLGEIYWDETAHVFSYPLVNLILPTLEDAKKAKLTELKIAVSELYNVIQWYLEMKRSNDEAIPLTVKNKIQNIRTNYLEEKAKINALPKVIDVLKYQLPMEAIAQMKSVFEAIDY